MSIRVRPATSATPMARAELTVAPGADSRRLAERSRQSAGFLALAATLLALWCSAAVRAAEVVVTVIRVLPDRVRITLDERQTLRVGTQLEVFRGSLVIAEIEVVFAGESDASCRILSQVEKVEPGDRARIRALEPRSGPVETEAAADVAAAAPHPVSTPSPAPAAPVRSPQPSAPDSSAAGLPAPAPEPEATTLPSPTAAAAPPSAEGAEGAGRFRVRQVVTGSVYLDGGRLGGLLERQRLRVYRADLEIALLEVAFLARNSAACSIVSSSVLPEVGDVAVAEPRPGASLEHRETSSARTGTPASGTSSGARSNQRSRSFADELSGSVAMRYQGFRYEAAEARDASQYALLLQLDYGRGESTPFRARVRARTGERRIADPSGPGETRPEDRLYELSVAYDPPEGRMSYEFGRLIAGPKVGFDYLDGLLAEVHLGERTSLGGFYGARANYDRVQLETGRLAYGGYYQYLNQAPGKPFYAEVVIGAIGEYEGGEVNREYLSLYGRQGSGSKWSLYENAEIDLNRTWRESETGSSYQLSNLLFTGTYSLTKAVRLGLSFDQRRRYRTLDDIDTPEALFDNALREGVRVTAYLGSGRSLRANLSGGVRRKEGGSERNLAYSASVYKSDLFGWNLLLGADYSGFSGDLSSGERAGIRAQKYFSTGHDVEITFGASRLTLPQTLTETENRWIRLSGTLQLWGNLYLLGEYETTSGDELAGDRLFLQLGYRL